MQLQKWSRDLVQAGDVSLGIVSVQVKLQALRLAKHQRGGCGQSRDDGARAEFWDASPFRGSNNGKKTSGRNKWPERQEQDL